MFRKIKSLWTSFHKDERGIVSATGLLMMGIGMIFLAVGFIVYPIVITATDAILDYTWTYQSVTDANFTGLTAVTGVTPLLVLMGFVTAGVVTGFLGVKMQRAGTGGSVNPGSLLMLAIGLIFIAVGLIIFPVVLDGVSSILAPDSIGTGISSSYTGLKAVLEVTPLLVLISFISAAVITGFFGVKGLSGGR